MSTAPLLTGAVKVRLAESADAPALLRLHQLSYDCDRSAAQWDWRYRSNPLRARIIVGAFTGTGDCVAMFCGVPLRCRFDGEETTICRAGDVAVHPELQKSVAGPKLLLRVSSVFVEEVGAAEHLAIFGFPEPGLSRTLVGHCRYEVMSDINWLTRSANESEADNEDALLSTRLSDGLPEDAGAFLQQWGESVPNGLVRDCDYLRWRYQDNPEAHYQFAAVRSRSGALRALAVLRDDSQLADTVVVVECMVPTRDSEARQAIFGAAANLARRCGRADIVTAVAANTEEFQLLQREHGLRVLVSPYQFVYRSYQPRVSRRFLFENWCYSAGDLDFM